MSVITNGLSFDDDGSGSPSTVVVVHADTGPELRALIRGYRWRYDHVPDELAGSLFAQSCEILKVSKLDRWSAVLLVTSRYDT